jgi:hypothetical protein
VKSELKIYKCDAQGDTIYIRATNELQARKILYESMGDIPDSLLTWSIAKKLPKGEEFLCVKFNRVSDTAPVSALEIGAREMLTNQQQVEAERKSTASASGDMEERALELAKKIENAAIASQYLTCPSASVMAHFILYEFQRIADEAREQECEVWHKRWHADLGIPCDGVHCPLPNRALKGEK